MNRTEILNTVTEIAVELLSVDASAVTETATFAEDLEADSLDVVELVMAIEEKLGISIPEEDLEGIKTIGEAIDVIVGKIGATA